MSGDLINLVSGDLISRLRDLAKAKHSDLSVADEAADEIESLIVALTAVVADVMDYERVNNLAPNPGQKQCWQSVTNAKAAIESAKD